MEREREREKKIPEDRLKIYTRFDDSVCSKLVKAGGIAYMDGVDKKAAKSALQKGRGWKSFGKVFVFCFLFSAGNIGRKNTSHVHVFALTLTLTLY